MRDKHFTADIDIESHVAALGAPLAAPLAFPKQDLTRDVGGIHPALLWRALGAILRRAWH